MKNKKLEILRLALKKMNIELLKIAYTPDFSTILESDIISELKKELDEQTRSLNLDYDLFEHFVDLNSEKFMEWDIAKLLGQGLSGEAWMMKDGKVLKIYRSKYKSGDPHFDESEQSLKNEIIKKLHSNEDDGSDKKSILPMIYENEKLEIPEEANIEEDIFYSTMEYVTQDPQNSRYNGLYEIGNLPFINSILSTLYNMRYEIGGYYFINFLREVKNKETIANMIREVLYDTNNEFDIYNDDLLRIIKEAKKQVFVHYNQSEESNISRNYNLRKDWLDDLVETIIVSRANGRTDLHAGNLGIRGNRFVFFDF
jgi:hypothetical protein